MLLKLEESPSPDNWRIPPDSSLACEPCFWICGYTFGLGDLRTQSSELRAQAFSLGIAVSSLVFKNSRHAHAQHFFYCCPHVVLFVRVCCTVLCLFIVGCVEVGLDFGNWWLRGMDSYYYYVSRCSLSHGSQGKKIN